MAREHPYDAIVLDIMLPGLNGYRVCATLREEGNWTPILMLTAKDGELDEAEALDTGADDYLTKPFSSVVLVARLRALIRRGAGERPAVLSAGDLRYDPAARRAWRGDVEVTLTAREAVPPRVPAAARRRGRHEDARSWTTCGTSGSRATSTSSRCTCGACATSSTGRSGGTPSRPSGEPATGSRTMAADRAPGRRSRAGGIRVRTTAVAVAAVGTALVVAAFAMVAYLNRSLREQVRTGALTRAVAIAREPSGPPVDALVTGGDPEEEFVQVLGPDGAVLSASPNVDGFPALVSIGPGETRTIEDVPFEDGPFLVVATRGGDETVVVGRSLEDARGAERAVTGTLLPRDPLARPRRGGGHVAGRRPSPSTRRGHP